MTEMRQQHKDLSSENFHDVLKSLGPQPMRRQAPSNFAPLPHTSLKSSMSAINNSYKLSDEAGKSNQLVTESQFVPLSLKLAYPRRNFEA